MTLAPVERIAIQRDIQSDTNAPPKPNSAQNTSKPTDPCASMPVTAITILKTTLTTSRMAMLVAKNSKILFIARTPGNLVC